MDFKNMTDYELASVMVNYISRVENLQNLIAKYLDGSNRGSIQADQIKNEYRRLKNELREDANDLGLERNHNGSALYMNIFSPSIREASAWGFTVPVNSAVNHSMYSAVEEAHYKLTKYYTFEEWGNLM